MGFAPNVRKVPPSTIFVLPERLCAVTVGSGTGVGVGVVADSPSGVARDAAVVGLDAVELDSPEDSDAESVVESDEHATATKSINDSSAKIGFILVLTKRARHPNRHAFFAGSLRIRRLIQIRSAGANSLTVKFTVIRTIASVN